MSDEDVGVAVAIKIAECDPGRPAYIFVEMGCLSDIGKGAVSVVAIQNDSAKATHQQIRSTIVVVITNCYAHCPTWGGHPGLVGNVGECSIMIVVIERAASLLSLKLHGNIWSAGEVDVEPAISIIVNQCHSAAHRLDNELLLWT